MKLGAQDSWLQYLYHGRRVRTDFRKSLSWPERTEKANRNQCRVPFVRGCKRFLVGGIFFPPGVNTGDKVARESDPHYVGRLSANGYQGGMMVFSFSPRYGWIG